MNNALVYEFHFNQSNIKKFIGKGKILKRSSVPCFHDMKERASVRERRTAAIRGKLFEISKEGSLEVLYGQQMIFAAHFNKVELNTELKLTFF